METQLSFPPCGTDIPYFGEDCNPQERHEFIDLRISPQRIDELPEVKWAPFLREFLLRVNAPRTIFKTFGCHFSVEKLLETNYEATSYVHLGFADPERCRNTDDYFRLFGRLASALHARPELKDEEFHRFRLNFQIETLREAGEIKGTIAALVCDVSAASENEARERWVKLMSAIGDHLSNEFLDESGVYAASYILRVVETGHPESQQVLILERTNQIKTWEVPPNGGEPFCLTRSPEGWQLKKGSSWISQIVKASSPVETFILKDQGDKAGTTLECTVS
jgi:hypothetical protein